MLKAAEKILGKLTGMSSPPPPQAEVESSGSSKPILRSLLINDSPVQVDASGVESWVQKVGKELHKRSLMPAARAHKEVSLVFLNPLEVKKLNWQYRMKDSPTDILSFESDDPESFGELVLCPQVIQEQAHKNSWTFDEELRYIVLHGVLHLLGYDHEKSEADDKAMMELQEQIFQALQPKKKEPKVKAKGKSALKAKADTKVSAKAAGKAAKAKPAVKAKAPKAKAKAKKK